MSLLDETSVLGYAAGRKVIGTGPASARMLSGGVSNVVLLVEQGDQRVVVKQARGKLQVTDDWFAERSRAQAEAAALRVIDAITPGRVPAVLDDDPHAYALTIEAAPPSWSTWKQRLLAGDCAPAVAEWLGGSLRSWHQATTGQALPAELDGMEAFRQLRLEPYFAVSARRCPQWASRLDHYVHQLTECRSCLVSGDFSPKNVLVGGDASWVIDWEVAHRGDPAFDVAFLLCHLLLKAVHLPRYSDEIRRCAAAFLAAYGDAAGAADGEHLFGLVGCLLLARVVGSSPAEYLTTTEGAAVRDAAGDILSRRPDRFGAVWRVVTDR